MSDNIMNYKGYAASVEYSAEDGCLVGHVLGLANSVIGFHGDSVAEVEEDFHNAIDSYLDACAEWGRKPDTPSFAEIRLELPAGILTRIAAQAESSGQSVNQVVVNDLVSLYPEGKTAKRKSKPAPARKGGKPHQGGKRAEVVG